jgi:hypothetical protein
MNSILFTGAIRFSIFLLIYVGTHDVIAKEYSITGHGFNERDAMKINIPCDLSALSYKSPVYLRCETHYTKESKADVDFFEPKGKLGELWYLREGKLNWSSKCGGSNPACLEELLKEKGRYFGLEAFQSRFLATLLDKLYRITIETDISNPKQECKNACHTLNEVVNFSTQIRSIIDFEELSSGEPEKQKIVEELTYLSKLKKDKLFENKANFQRLRSLLVSVIRHLDRPDLITDCMSTFGFNTSYLSSIIDQLISTTEKMPPDIFDELMMEGNDEKISEFAHTYAASEHKVRKAYYKVREDILTKWRNISFFESIMNVYCQASNEQKPLVIRLGRAHCPGVTELVKSLDHSIPIQSENAGKGMEKIVLRNE